MLFDFVEVVGGEGVDVGLGDDGGVGGVVGDGVGWSVVGSCGIGGVIGVVVGVVVGDVWLGGDFVEMVDDELLPTDGQDEFLCDFACATVDFFEFEQADFRAFVGGDEFGYVADDGDFFF